MFSESLADEFRQLRHENDRLRAALRDIIQDAENEYLRLRKFNFIPEATNVRARINRAEEVLAESAANRTE